jgi:hypothetical protein
MRRTRVVLLVAAALSASSCGEITAFCMTAGAPDGVTLVLTTTPSGLQCTQRVIADSLPPRSPSGGARVAHPTPPDSNSR